MPDEISSTPPSTGARSTPRGGAAKPRPRTGIQRKTKAEREQFAKEEAERQKARAAEHEVANRGGRGGRATSRGGRGGTAAGQRDEPVGGGGVFGTGPGAKAPTKSRTSYEGYTELVERGLRGGTLEDTVPDGSASGRGSTVGQNGSGQAGTSAGRKVGISRTAEALDMDTYEEPDNERGRDIDFINISSSNEEHEELELRPVRAQKIEAGGEGKTKRVRSKKGAVKKADAETQELDSKSEQDEDTEDADSESLQFVKEQPSSPEMRKRTLKKQLGTAKMGRETKGSVTETVEERAERMRATKDVQKLRDLFVTQSEPDVKMKVDEEEETTDEENEAIARLKSRFKEGKMFLFQLPPLTPFLVDSSTMHTNELGVRAEATADDNTTTINLDAPDERTAGSNAAGDPDIKADPDAPAKGTRPDLQMDGLLTASEPSRLPAGIVGKLRVHKSGKVTLDWGGTDMEVRYGAEVDFLQDVVLVEPGREQDDAAREGDRDGEDGHENENENGNIIGAGSGDGDGDDDGDGADKDKKDIKGRAYALGRVRRKMVLIPDWVKLYD